MECLARMQNTVKFLSWSILLFICAEVYDSLCVRWWQMKSRRVTPKEVVAGHKFLVFTVCIQFF
jgi:hypothetical protein